MNRIVRDMKQKLGKDVRLTIVGENTEVDKSIVDNIGDPIMHIVRNSMDHGIESTEKKNVSLPAKIAKVKLFCLPVILAVKLLSP